MLLMVFKIMRLVGVSVYCKLVMPAMYRINIVAWGQENVSFTVTSSFYVLLQVWDTIRRVRCLWEGNIRESLSVSVAIGMLNQEIVTFSGDSAVARLDIQVCTGVFCMRQCTGAGWMIDF